MDINEIKKILKEKSVDPLLIVAANKGYKWVVDNNFNEEDASSFEQYILNSTTAEELKELRNKRKSLKDFIMWKYIKHLELSENN